jgi:ribosome modulation factor
MTPFEQGYKALMEGKDEYDNPFDKDTCPCSHKKWIEGWSKSRKEHPKR